MIIDTQTLITAHKMYTPGPGSKRPGSNKPYYFFPYLSHPYFLLGNKIISVALDLLTMSSLYVLVLLSLSQLAYGQYDYGDALAKSLLFYEGQRSGDLPDDNRYEGGLVLKSG